ncbi:glycosyltransferase family 2 protein [Streptomyces monticola]|uniref:Glycosyltransferase family 2 protein n=1 Tax=Streptomyces monticola TaxID=2666263 RepID=A0ABW2JPI3_9ACTN
MDGVVLGDRLNDALLLLVLVCFAYSALVLSRFFVYWLAVSRAYHRRQPDPSGDQAAYDWHVFVPCRDEEAVVHDTLDALRTGFPACHVWLIDDASEDRTLALAERYAHADDRVHLVARQLPRARIGKGAALNSAYQQLSSWLPVSADRSRVVVAVVDADGRLAGGALAHVAGALADPAVGAAQIGVRMRNADDPRPRPDRGRLGNAWARLLVRTQDVEFSVNNAGMQLLRRRTGSVGLGGNGQFVRLTALDSLAGTQLRPWSQRALLEDYESGLELLLNGWQVTHLHDTYVTQEATASARRFLAQRTRWAQGNLHCLSYTGRVVRSTRLPWLGKAEILYTFLQPVAAVTLTVTTPLCLLIPLLTHDAPDNALYTRTMDGLADHMTLLLLVPVVFGVLPLMAWGLRYRRDRCPGRGLLAGLVWGLAMWLYAYHLFVVSTRGAVRIVLGREGWAKTRRNAEAIGVGPVAKEV